jgi:hypothetical protein
VSLRVVIDALYGRELHRHLQSLTSQLRHNPPNGPAAGAIRDSNGNVVGSWSWS